MTDARESHTHHMYDAVHAQPALIGKVLAQRAEIEHAADAVAAKERITFVGIGSSLHIARICESWMRENSIFQRGIGELAHHGDLQHRHDLTTFDGQNGGP